VCTCTQDTDTDRQTDRQTDRHYTQTDTHRHTPKLQKLNVQGHQLHETPR